MKDNETVKALKCCIASKCGECPIFNNSEIRRVPGRCVATLEKDALDLINRLEAENGKLQAENKGLTKEKEKAWDYSCGGNDNMHYSSGGIF